MRMTQEDVLAVIRQSIWTILTLAMPMLIVSMAIGLVIAIFQAATQIHEQTITFVPKLVAIGLMLIFLGSWILTTLDEFFHYIVQLMIG